MIAYLDMPSGISGDMFLGCLVDAGWPVEALRAVIEQLGLPDDEWHVEAESVMRGPLRATLLRVTAAESQQHRHLSDITHLLTASALPANIQRRAVAVFTRLAEAEAAVHGVDVEQVHFHEVGALDAIIDIVGVVAGLDALGIDQLFASPLPIGPGWTNSQHGRIPLPAPATLELLARAGAPTRPSPGPGELVTPTGAALVAELAQFGQPSLQLRSIAVGAGFKEFDWPNIARLWLGEAEQRRAYVQIETNIDDMNPELYAAVRGQLSAAGALDVWTTPIQMKKERPGVLLGVLAERKDEAALAALILRETTTLGMRVHEVYRHEAERQLADVQTDFGLIGVKLKFLDGELLGAKPEYEDCQRAAQEHGLPVRVVYEAALAASHRQWLQPAGHTTTV